MRTLPLIATGFLAAVLLLVGCGKKEESSSRQQPKPTVSVPFPKGENLTLPKLRRSYPQALTFAASGGVLNSGSNRVGFALLDAEQTFINNASVALYVANSTKGKLRGPIAVKFEPITLRPAYRSQTTASDEDGVSGIYVANVDFKRSGTEHLVAVVKADKGLIATTVQAVRVGVQGGPPNVGEPAIRVHTPVASEVADIGEIDTRVPPDTMHKHDLADVLGKQPVVLVFATPQLCQSRVCGPVVDVAEQVQAQHGKNVAFIHMEIYNKNDVSKGFRPQVGAWHLPSEPWTFVINKQGRIAERFEGALSVRELERAVAKVGQSE